MSVTVESRWATGLKVVREWYCAACDEFHQGEKPESRAYYNTDSLIEHIRNRGVPFEVGEGEIEQLASDSVDEITMVCCENDCYSDEDDCYGQSGYECPVCSEVHEDAHRARDCCLHHCIDGCEEDTCLNTVNTQRYAQEQGWSYCFCDVNGSNTCMVKICLTCHGEIYGDESEHVQEHSLDDQEDTETYDEEVNVGRPASLPQAYEYVDASKAAVVPASKNCAVCDSEFCCETHNKHVPGHRGHQG